MAEDHHTEKNRILRMLPIRICICTQILFSGAREGGLTLRKGVLLPSKRLL